MVAKSLHTHSILQSSILNRMDEKPGTVCTLGDFADLAKRSAIDKALQRLTSTGDLRRIDRGLYDRPSVNSLTGLESAPDYRSVIDAVTGRGQARYLVDGMTAANDLGLTNAIPARIEVLTDTRLRPVHLGEQTVHFKQSAPSRLYWAGRPAMRIVQALHWLKDVLEIDDERVKIRNQFLRILTSSEGGTQLTADLRDGFTALPIWMQDFLRPLILSDIE